LLLGMGGSYILFWVDRVMCDRLVDFIDVIELPRGRRGRVDQIFSILSKGGIDR
jgi:hypothetical protein